MFDLQMKRVWGPTPSYPLVKAYKNHLKHKIFIAGPCAVESVDSIWMIANKVANHGATHLRGGVFRAGTYPSAQFGLVPDELLQAYRDASNYYRLKNIIEVLDYSDESIEKLSKYCDCFQVGARSQQNYTLLRKLGATGKPIFLKRNPGSTLDEFLGSAEHVLKSQTKKDLYLIERGSSTFENHTRWTLSISMIAAIKAITKVPIIVDASHGTGRFDLVEPMTLAGMAAGADGCLVEVHNDPRNSLSDADQAIGFTDYKKLMVKINNMLEVV